MSPSTVAKAIILRSSSAVSPTGKSEGAWDSIHVFEAIDRARTAHYKLTSTVILHLNTGAESLGEMDLSGNMTRQVRTSLHMVALVSSTNLSLTYVLEQVEQDMPVDDDLSHISNIGKVRCHSKLMKISIANSDKVGRRHGA
ncbi:hypothetical protein GP486_003390 [Trichoglossum hirsutum]|uniref:F-actin-capping protein subunit beta n=1 Tax=Trichoglossum hirsutum TaxID=265104 RepID=A0A9P8RQR6_9PEZI|nr:hypothetical protein GP486_003390 [Trichoglossum hirsutum]